MEELTEELTDAQREIIAELEQRGINFDTSRAHTPPWEDDHGCALLVGFADYPDPGTGMRPNAYTLSAAFGWPQLQTWQDASYFGIFYSTSDHAILAYVEGDTYLTCAPSHTAFVAALREKANFHDADCPVKFPTPSAEHARNIWEGEKENGRTFLHPDPEDVEHIDTLDDYGALVFPADEPHGIAVYHYGDTYILVRDVGDDESARVESAQVATRSLSGRNHPIEYDNQTTSLNEAIEQLQWTAEERPCSRKAIFDACGHHVGTFTAGNLWRHIQTHGFAEPK